jgi:hypothetical protein
MPRRPIDPADFSPAMRRALQSLRKEGFHPEVTSLHQLKIEDLNFYPARGTIYRDGDQRALAQSGLAAFLKLLRQGSDQQTIRLVSTT